MMNIPLTEILAKMPVAELEQSMEAFLFPMARILPEERLRRVVTLAVRGILAQETPVIAAMAQSTPRQEMSCYAGAKRIYRFVWMVIGIRFADFSKPCKCEKSPLKAAQ